jgi:hypothetical protein
VSPCRRQGGDLAALLPADLTANGAQDATSAMPLATRRIGVRWIPPNGGVRLSFVVVVRWK